MKPNLMLLCPEPFVRWFGSVGRGTINCCCVAGHQMERSNIEWNGRLEQNTFYSVCRNTNNNVIRYLGYTNDHLANGWTTNERSYEELEHDILMKSVVNWQMNHSADMRSTWLPRWGRGWVGGLNLTQLSSSTTELGIGWIGWLSMWRRRDGGDGSGW